MNHRSRVLLGFATLLGACRGSSSPGSSPAPLVTNLALAVHGQLGDGNLRVALVSETEQGRDLDGDGDLFDGDVVHVIDLERGSALDTGLALGRTFPRDDGEFIPAPVAAIGSSLVAFGVSESETGGLDRNGDGDAFDLVLALYRADTGVVENLGVAVSRVLTSDEILAWNVPEAAQGAQDLDGDGVVDPRTTVPFVHDLATGETWNTGLRGAKVQAVDGTLVALSIQESLAGDRNGDGDVFDIVFDLYDAATRRVHPVGLAVPTFFGFPAAPYAHRGSWLVQVPEESQGASDLNGDGDASDEVYLVYDPRTERRRSLGDLVPEIPPLDVAPFVLADGFSLVNEVWLHDPERDELRSTGFFAHYAVSLGERLVLPVSEERQGEDLDHDGKLESTVPVLLDPATGKTTSLGVNGGPRPVPDGLFLFSPESRPEHDWNGDGDFDDQVLQLWEARTGALVNTRLAPNAAEPVGDAQVLVALSEADAATDWNGDGDQEDEVLHVYDRVSRRVRNLGLASGFVFTGFAGGPALVGVREDAQGQDLNGDGDLFDVVLHVVAPR